MLLALTSCRTGSDAALGQRPTAYDPVTTDPPVRDSAHPPGLAELTIHSAGERLNGIFYLPEGVGPHPVVVLLHGNPGNERNLDLAQSLRRAGYAVLFFNYRGSWGSGGSFSRTHALEDVRAALAFLRLPQTAAQFGTSPARVALLGHSMGGWLALLTSAVEPDVRCVAAVDFSNTGTQGRQLRVDAAAESAAIAENDGLTAPGGPYRTEGGGAALVAEMEANAEEWDVVRWAPELRQRQMLLIAAVNRADQDALVRALGGPSSAHITAYAWDTDHAFSDRRIALAHLLVQWLRMDCRL
jgi:pimeloyl-ACP methyl ester carboxylesterase